MFRLKKKWGRPVQVSDKINKRAGKYRAESLLTTGRTKERSVPLHSRRKFLRPRKQARPFAPTLEEAAALGAAGADLQTDRK